MSSLYSIFMYIYLFNNHHSSHHHYFQLIIIIILVSINIHNNVVHVCAFHLLIFEKVKKNLLYLYIFSIFNYF